MPRTHVGAGKICSAARRPAVEAVEPRLLLAAFIVSNVNDAGPGSLRQAILDSNVTAAEKDVINFSITSGVVQLRSPLPPITSPVAIDTAQDERRPAIEIDGAAAGPGAHGLVINTSPLEADVTATEVAGLALYHFGGDGVRVNGNSNLLDHLYIGTDAAGANPLGNAGRGVVIQGGDNAVSNTTIAFNGSGGITVLSGAGNDLSYSNSVFSNGGLAIDLGGDGHTANDTGDADAGPNNLQNAPVITSVAAGPGGTTVSGSVSTTPNTGLLISLYTNMTPDPEGRRYLGSVDGVSNAAGNFTFDRVLPSIVRVDYVTVTATAFMDDAAVGTSEFSPAVTFAAPPSVTGVWLSGSTWTPAGRGLLQTTGGGSAKNGWPVRDGALELATVPYGNADRIAVQFTENVNVDQADLSVTGVNQADYPVTGFAYDPYTYTATWTLSAPLGLDHVELIVNGGAGGVSDAQNNLLDGEWTSGADLFPSGNGTAGGDFRFRIRVAPGDLNADGVINGSDFAVLAGNFGKVNQLPVMGDFTGDGAVNGSDFAILAGNFGRSVPEPQVLQRATALAVSAPSIVRRSSAAATTRRNAGAPLPTAVKTPKTALPSRSPERRHGNPRRSAKDIRAL
jgi:hypothetical protein